MLTITYSDGTITTDKCTLYELQDYNEYRDSQIENNLTIKCILWEI